MIILNLSESFPKPPCHGKAEHGIFVKFKKPIKTAVVLIAGVTILGTPCPWHITVPFGDRSTFGPRGQGLSNHTSFLRPALPMAPKTDDNARDEWSILCPNPATFLWDFTLHMTTNYAVIWKRCLNYITCLIIGLSGSFIPNQRWVRALEMKWNE